MTTLHVGSEIEGICSAWFNPGYGFVRVAGAARDVVVSADSLIETNSLIIGERVRFVVSVDRDGCLFADRAQVIGVRVS